MENLSIELNNIEKSLENEKTQRNQLKTQLEATRYDIKMFEITIEYLS